MKNHSAQFSPYFKYNFSFELNIHFSYPRSKHLSGCQGWHSTLECDFQKFLWLLGARVITCELFIIFLVVQFLTACCKISCDVTLPKTNAEVPRLNKGTKILLAMQLSLDSLQAEDVFSL